VRVLAVERVDSGADLGGPLPDRGSGHVRGSGCGALDGEKVGEIEAGGGAPKIEDGGIVSTRRRDWRGIGTKPNPRTLVGFSNLSDPLAPLPHPDSFVARGFTLFPSPPRASSFSLFHGYLCKKGSTSFSLSFSVCEIPLWKSKGQRVNLHKKHKQINK